MTEEKPSQRNTGEALPVGPSTDKPAAKQETSTAPHQSSGAGIANLTDLLAKKPSACQVRRCYKKMSQLRRIN